MFKMLKEKGFNQPITIINTEKHTSIPIGVLTTDIKAILEEKGLLLETLLPTDEWDVEITGETAQLLVRRTLPKHKPMRKQVEKPKDLFQKPNKEIDAMDVLLGLANYN